MSPFPRMAVLSSSQIPNLVARVYELFYTRSGDVAFFSYIPLPLCICWLVVPTYDFRSPILPFFSLSSPSFDLNAFIIHISFSSDHSPPPIAPCIHTPYVVPRARSCCFSCIVPQSVVSHRRYTTYIAQIQDQFIKIKWILFHTFYVLNRFIVPELSFESHPFINIHWKSYHRYIYFEGQGSHSMNYSTVNRVCNV